MTMDTKTISELIGEGGVFCDGDWIESKDQDPNGDVRLIQLADIGDGCFRDRSKRFLTLEKAKELKCTFLEPGDVLVARMPDPLGRACVFPGVGMPAVTAVDVCIIRPTAANAKWLANAINSPFVRRQIEALQKGTTRKRISRKNLATIPLPYHSIDEQRAIVDEIEKQFSRLDAGVEALKRVQANLKRYRASVLNSIFDPEDSL